VPGVPIYPHAAEENMSNAEPGVLGVEVSFFLVVGPISNPYITGNLVYFFPTYKLG